MSAALAPPLTTSTGDHRRLPRPHQRRAGAFGGSRLRDGPEAGLYGGGSPGERISRRADAGGVADRGWFSATGAPPGSPRSAPRQARRQPKSADFVIGQQRSPALPSRHEPVELVRRDQVRSHRVDAPRVQRPAPGCPRTPPRHPARPRHAIRSEPCPHLFIAEPTWFHIVFGWFELRTNLIVTTG